MTETRRSVTISTGKLAEWIDSQEGTWWWIDGYPDFAIHIIFPCPKEELVEALRRRDREFEIILQPEAPDVIGEPNLDALVDTNNRQQSKVLVATGAGAHGDWLIREEKEMAELARREFAESLHGHDPD